MISELKTVLSAYRGLSEAWISSEKNTDEYLASVCFFENMTYRLYESDKTDPLIGLRMAVRLWRRLGKSPQNGVVPLNQDGKIVIVGGLLKTSALIIRYIQGNSSEKVHSYLAKDFIATPPSMRVKIFVAMLPFVLKQTWRCLYKKNRVNLALAIHEVFEISYILNYLNSNALTELYDWIPYEKDSNFLSLLAQKQGVFVTKLPSSGPLVTHNRFMLSQQLVLTTPYQYEELVKYGDTITAQKVLRWPPQGAMDYGNLYKEKRQTTSKTIGFFSHGSWIRKQEKHAEHGRNVLDAEKTILSFLGKFVEENPEYKILIFPHPREKKKEISEHTKAFYRKCIGHNKFDMIASELTTSDNFEKADVGLGAFSSILYERMFCGFKVLIGNIGFSDFPMTSSKLNQICFDEYDEMKLLLLHYSNVSAEVFFEETGLSAYNQENKEIT